MNDKEQELYDKIMHGGYGTVQIDGLMIVGNIEILKNVVLLPAPVKRKTREQHLKEIGELDEKVS